MRVRFVKLTWNGHEATQKQKNVGQSTGFTLKRFPICFFSTKLEEIAYSLPFLLDINRQYYLRKEKSHILWYQPLLFRLSDLLMFAVTDQTCHLCSADILTGLNFLMGPCWKKNKTAKQSPFLRRSKVSFLRFMPANNETNAWSQCDRSIVVML